MKNYIFFSIFFTIPFSLSAMIMPDEEPSDEEQPGWFSTAWHNMRQSWMPTNTTPANHAFEFDDQLGQHDQKSPDGQEQETNWWSFSSIVNAASTFKDQTLKEAINYSLNTLDQRYIEPFRMYAKPVGYSCASILSLYIAYKIGMHKGRKENKPTHPNLYYHVTFDE